MGPADPFAVLLHRQQEITEAYRQLLLAQARFWEDFSSLLRIAARLQSSFSHWLAASAEFYRALIGVRTLAGRGHPWRFRVDVPGA